MKSLTIYLTEQELAQLTTMAQQQRRKPADQAAHLVALAVADYMHGRDTESEDSNETIEKPKMFHYFAPEGRVIELLPFEQRVANRIAYMAHSLGITPEEITVTLAYGSSDGKAVEVNASADEV